MKLKIFLIMIFSLLISFNVNAESENYIVKLKNDLRLFSESKEPFKVVNKEELSKLIKEDKVLYYEPDYKVKLFSDNRNREIINKNYANTLGTTGNKIRVGIIDSGVNIKGDIEKNIIEGYNYTSEVSPYDFSDDIGHGTFVTGIIASESSGIAENSEIIALKCFKQNYDTGVSVIARAIYDAVDNYNCDVLNMSFGMSKNSKTLEDAINYASSKGIIICAAVGNYGTEQNMYPASYNNVIGVGSVDINKNISCFSQRNNSVFVTAPGEGYLGYLSDKEAVGTSFSCPHVTALASVLKSLDKKIDINYFKEILINSSEDLGEKGYDFYYGYGLIDIKNAMDCALENKKTYMSPVNKGDNNLYTVIYNNENINKNLTLICMEENRKPILKTVSLKPFEKYIFSNLYKGVNQKYTVWDNLINIKPLVNVRE